MARKSYNRNKGHIMKYTSILLITTLFFIGCTSTQTAKNKEPREVTISIDNYPHIFDELARSDKGTFMGYSAESKAYFESRAIELYGNKLADEERDKIYWENFEFFIKNVLQIPGYTEIENFSDRIDGLIRVERFFLRRNYYMALSANDYVEKRIYENRVFIGIPLEDYNSSADYFPLRMLLFIDGQTINLIDRTPQILYGGKLWTIFSLASHRDLIINCSSFGYNMRDKRIDLDEPTLIKLKAFLSN